MVKKWEKLAAKIDNNKFLKIIDRNLENINRIPKNKNNKVLRMIITGAGGYWFCTLSCAS